MNRLLLGLAVGAAACHADAASKRADRCDTSTDEGVRAAYQKATGHALPPKSEWQCIDRASAFPKAVSIGSFANDRGCMYDGILYGCTFADAKDLQVQILADAGWAKADQAGKQQLVSDYWSEFYETQILDTGERFPADHPFTAPIWTWNPDGSLTLTYWTGRSHGMTIGSHYTRSEDHVGADGALGESKMLEEFDTNE